MKKKILTASLCAAILLSSFLEEMPLAIGAAAYESEPSAEETACLDLEYGASSLAAPTASKESGTITCSKDYAKIKLSAEKGTIYYSLNGAKYKKYTSAIKLTKNSTIKAYAKSGSTKSKTVTFTYKLKPKVTGSATNTSDGKNVKFTTKVSGVKLYYTTDGSKPTTSSKAYPSSGITLTQTCKLRVIAVKSGWANATLSQNFTVSAKPSTTTTPVTSTLPETDVSLFSYNEENGAIEITFYKGSDKEVRIPSKINGKPVTRIGPHAFEDSMGDRGAFVTSVTIPDSVTTIGHYAFWNCPLTSLTIPNSVTNIDMHAFDGCDHLTSITLPDNVSTGNSAFARCNSLTSVTIPSGTEMGSGTFSYCESLTSVTVQDGVPYIGAHSFNGCTSLKSITIPDSVKSIGLGAFEGCTSLKSITIPNSVTEIRDIAFENCTSLKSVTISDGVKEIGENAFANCKSLTSVTIPDSVTKIGSGRLILSMMGIDDDMGAFLGCKCTVTYKGKKYTSADNYEALYKAINGN